MSVIHFDAEIKEGLSLIERVVRKIIPEMDMESVITSFAGVRANIRSVAKEEKDFVIRKSVPGMISTLGIKNPGLTSAPYLTEIILQLLKEDGMELIEKRDYHPGVKTGKKFIDCTADEKKLLFKKDSAYGNMICRCENITEGDIRRVLSEPIPPTTLNGLKKRLRAGMGRCQGGILYYQNYGNIEPAVTV